MKEKDLKKLRERGLLLDPPPPPIKLVGVRNGGPSTNK
jgi:hypothetical protein